MTVPEPYVETPNEPAKMSSLVRAAIWVAIGALIAAAIVCVVWVLIGTQNGIVGRAFLTILLLAAFAGVAILDAHLAPRRPSWFALTSMVVWVVTLLLGAVMIWMPERFGFGFGFDRFVRFLLIVLILQLGVLHLRLYMKAYLRHVTGFTTAVTIVTLALVALLAVMLVFPLVLSEYIDFSELYWRFVVAITILAAVGTALLPLTNALFAPKKPRPQPQPFVAPGTYAPQPWPTYVDGTTPLPVMPDGSPDWNAYYTGYPSYPQQGQTAAVPAPAYPPAEQPHGAQPAAYPPVEQQPTTYPQPPTTQPQPPVPPTGYEGYPPPPPLPPTPPRP